MAKPVFVLNGPNLNMLGTREPEVYGRRTLADIEALCARRAKSLGMSIAFRQTNSEAELIGWVQEAASQALAVVINAAGLTHTSVALHDALKACGVPVVEVHLSNIYRREPFRHMSYVSPAASGGFRGGLCRSIVSRSLRWRSADNGPSRTLGAWPRSTSSPPR